jgi:hypothetical protein
MPSLCASRINMGPPVPMKNAARISTQGHAYWVLALGEAADIMNA